jgi:hypothetical protein
MRPSISARRRFALAVFLQVSLAATRRVLAGTTRARASTVYHAPKPHQVCHGCHDAPKQSNASPEPLSLPLRPRVRASFAKQAFSGLV